MEKIVSLCKRRGFIYPSFEIYGGLAGFYDYGPLGVALKKNITNLWWKQFVTDREDIYGIDTVEVTKKEVLEASGHVGGFADPVVECEKCKRGFRTDQLEITKGNRPKWFCPNSNCDYLNTTLKEHQFNMMLKTHVGASEDAASVAYLRPETAPGIFTNLQNIVDSFHLRCTRRARQQEDFGQHRATAQ